MKTKSVRSTAQSGPLEVIRKGTHYKGARSFFGLPFLIAGGLMVLGGFLTFALSLRGGGAELALAFLPCVLTVIAGLFCFGISALGSAVFDIADAAVRNDARESHREAKESYDAYRAAQGMR